MEELENANPTMKNSGENPVNPNSVDIENSAIEQQSTDFSQLFSENISEEAPVQEELVQEEPIQQEEISSPAQSEPQEVKSESQMAQSELQEAQSELQEAQPELQEAQPELQEAQPELQEAQPELQEAQPELQEAQPELDNTQITTQVTDVSNTETNVLNPEFTNNENDIQISEHAFDSVIDHTSLDNHQNIQTAQVTAEQRKAAIEQQKLAWLKQHESKAKKSGFTSGILSGILLMLLAFAACSVFAKEQILNAIDYLGTIIPLNNSTTNNVQNTINLPDTEEAEIVEEENTEEVDEIQAYYNKVDEIVTSESDSENKTEQLKNILSEVMEKEEPNEELTQYISQAIDNLAMDNIEELQNEQNENTESEKNAEDNTGDSEYYNETVEENNENELTEMGENTDSEISSDAEPTETIEEEKIEPYTITHVNSEEEANWVLPSHCSDLTCYGEDQEFVECTSFRMIETLDENTSRVSSRGGCKYKDASELVFVQFN